MGYVSLIWIIERHPPTLGEVGELAEAQTGSGPKRVGRDLVFVLLAAKRVSVAAADTLFSADFNPLKAELVRAPSLAILFLLVITALGDVQTVGTDPLRATQAARAA